MKMILFNQNPMIAKLLESVSKKLELSIENFNHYQELSARLKKDPEWLLIADDECLEKLDQVDWLELKETISQNKNSVCMYKKGNESQPFLEGFEMKIKKPFLPTEVLKILQKKLGSDMSELEPSQNLDPTQEILETNWDELENLGDLEALAKEESNNEEQLLPTLDAQEVETPKEETQEEVKKEEVKEMQEEIKEKEKQEVAENPQDEEKPKDDETQGSVETPKDEEVSKELETQEKLEIPKEETQKEVKEEIKEETQEQEPIKEEMQENKEEKQEKTQDSPSTQELEAMQELVKEIQENSNEDKKETQENAEIPQDKEIQEVVTEKTQAQELEIPKEKTQESAEALQETQAHELEKQEIAETPQELEIPQAQEKETPQEETQEVVTEKTQVQEKETPKTQEDHYESIEDIPEPVMAKAMGEELPFLNEAVAKTPNNENDTETPKESVTEISKNENATETPQEKEESDKTSSPLELHLNLQDLLKSLNQESLKSLLENKTLSIKITLEDKKPNA
ncbi:chemotaxis regulatory protein ChePep [Helicobacter pylori]|uniref:chemotaxis regulatory protein ChePep n=1 Tax=Helicobacter pylori TaxID=210 RepID=UPI00165AA052|nr:chemotaxis regulatory protein ChePep [Helicobacter pylori]